MKIFRTIGEILVISRQVIAIEVLKIPVVALVKEDSDCHDFTETQATRPPGVSLFLDEHGLPSGFKRKTEIIDITEQAYQRHESLTDANFEC